MIIVVVAIAIPALLIILGQEAKQSVNAELEIAATNVAQAKMEETKTPGFAGIGIATTPYSTTVGGNNYSGNVTVCYVASSDLNACIVDPTDYKQISVTVTSPTQVEFVTVVANY